MFLFLSHICHKSVQNLLEKHYQISHTILAAPMPHFYKVSYYVLQVGSFTNDIERAQKLFRINISKKLLQLE